MAIHDSGEQESCSRAETPPGGGTDPVFRQGSPGIELALKNSRGHAIGWPTLPLTTPLKMPFLGRSDRQSELKELILRFFCLFLGARKYPLEDKRSCRNNPRLGQAAGLNISGRYLAGQECHRYISSPD